MVKKSIIILIFHLYLLNFSYSQENLIKDIIQSIPSPLEISSLIKQQGSKYNPQLLSNTSISKYNTSFKKALNLGVLGTDLGFCNIYEKKQDALKYLSSVKLLADALAIGQFFDYNTIKKLTQANSDPQELLNVTTSNLEKINYYLRNQRRENISILMLTGGWVEALYLICNVYKETKSSVLKDKIADQKIVLDQILLVLNNYKNKSNYNNLINNLLSLQKVYHSIRIETQYKAPTMKEVNGVIEIQDNTVSKAYITNQNIVDIITKIKKIRSNITN